MVATNYAPNDLARLTLYESTCRVRRTQRLAGLLKQTDRVVYATHMNMGSIYLATEMQVCADGANYRESERNRCD